MSNVLVKEINNKFIEIITRGKQGISGKSAYIIAIENGFKGTEKEWLSSLKGEAFTYDNFTDEQLAELTGPKGDTGYTYTPEVDTNGNISWTNNGNLVNPTTVNIKGPKGDKGDIGLTGEKGETGYYFQPHIDNYYNLSWTNNGGLENPELINIKGPKGDKGNTGTAATISIGTVSTGEAGTSVSVTNSGSSNAAIFNFIIPKGDKGDKGDVGDPFRIIKVYKSVGNMNSDYNNPDIPIGSFVIIETGDVNNSDNSKLFVKTDSGYSFITDLSGSQGIQGPIGEKGDTGLSATIDIGVVDTVDSNSNAEVTNSGTINNAIFNFKIPRGEKGDTGNVGPQGPQGETGSEGPQGPQGITFTPSISSSGDLSWTNDGGLVNPTTVNIIGPQGIQGEQGPQGVQGEKGEKGDTGLKGDTGDIGPRGYTFTPFVAENGDITWTNNGSLPNPVKVNIMGPQGPKGDTGSQGIQGIQGLKGDTGAVGPQGKSAIISEVSATIDNNVGTPSVTVDLGGTELNRTFTFNFKNIKGEQGIQGIQGKTGPQGKQGIQGIKGDTGDTGPKGDQGISVTNAKINFNNGHLILTLE